MLVQLVENPPWIKRDKGDPFHKHLELFLRIIGLQQWENKDHANKHPKWQAIAAAYASSKSLLTSVLLVCLYKGEIMMCIFYDLF